MKVLILINSFGMAGAEKSTALIILRINEKYKNINFVCAYLEPYMPGYYDEIEQNNIPLIHIKEKGFLGRIKKVRAIIGVHKPDVVHSVLHEANMLARFSSFGLEPVFVESLVGKPYSKGREYQSQMVKIKHGIAIKFIDKWSSYLVDHFHSVGHAVAKHYLEVFSRNFAYTVVERGRPPRPSSSIIKKDTSERKVLVTLARHECLKGLIYLLEAMVFVKDKAKLKIIGREGATTGVLKSFIRKNQLEDCVELCGFYQDVFPALTKADAYISASLSEGLPGSVIEAMSCGLPLILSDIAEHREVGIENENALFFHSKNPHSIAEKINMFLENEKLLKEFGNRSLSLFMEKFTEDAMVEGMATFYKKMIKYETK